MKKNRHPPPLEEILGAPLTAGYPQLLYICRGLRPPLPCEIPGSAICVASSSDFLRFLASISLRHSEAMAFG